MCIISGEVREVSGTNILVAYAQPDGAVKKQFTAYCNTAAMADNLGVMVLPVPKAAGFTPVNLEPVKNLFHLLKAACPVDPVSRSSYSTNTFGAGEELKVLQVGSYKTSYVPSHADFPRLSSAHFPLDPSVLRFLKDSYDDGLFGFAVFRLDRNQTYHPFGYLHATLPDSTLFIPTVHLHMHRQGEVLTNEVDWDHRIWCMNAAIGNLAQEVRNTNTVDPNHIQLVPFDKLPQLLSCRTLSAYRIDRSYRANHDLIATPTVGV